MTTPLPSNSTRPALTQPDITQPTSRRAGSPRRGGRGRVAAACCAALVLGAGLTGCSAADLDTAQKTAEGLYSNALDKAVLLQLEALGDTMWHELSTLEAQMRAVTGGDGVVPTALPGRVLAELITIGDAVSGVSITAVGSDGTKVVAWDGTKGGDVAAIPDQVQRLEFAKSGVTVCAAVVAMGSPLQFSEGPCS